MFPEWRDAKHQSINYFFIKHHLLFLLCEIQNCFRIIKEVPYYNYISVKWFLNLNWFFTFWMSYINSLFLTVLTTHWKNPHKKLFENVYNMVHCRLIPYWWSLSPLDQQQNSAGNSVYIFRVMSMSYDLWYLWSKVPDLTQASFFIYILHSQWIYISDWV